MALGATKSPNQAFEVAKATAKELAAVGINWNFAPVLDVISEQGNRDISVRAFGDDPQTVGRFGVAFAEGLRAGGVGHCAKHFPGTTVTKDGLRRSVFETKANDEIEAAEMVPFKRAVAAGLDSVMLSSSIWPGSVGEDGSSNASRAKHVIQEVLRRQLGYEGVAICDVTDMPIFSRNPQNIGEAMVTAIAAGCDMLQIYHNPTIQTQGISAIYEALQKDRLRRSDIYRSASLVMRLKNHYFSWRTALAAPDPQRLQILMQQHQVLSRKAFENSLTLVRDERTLIPLSSKLKTEDEVLLLTPVVRPLHQRPAGESTMDPFECLGRALAQRHRRILHAPYTAHGITPTHKALIGKCAAVVFVTTNAKRPNARTQLQAAEVVHQLCYSKPLINIAACDPYDLLEDKKCGYSNSHNIGWISDNSRWHVHLHIRILPNSLGNGRCGDIRRAARSRCSPRADPRFTGYAPPTTARESFLI
jgi:beta-N-acetylhexosaminidase